METTTATITIRCTDSPSRSKGTYSCWVLVGESPRFVHEGETKRIPLERNTAIKVGVKATLRRTSGRSDVARDNRTLVVTGDEADTIELSAGSPQRATMVITGAREQ